MKRVSDFHIHTSVSCCCKEDYGILDAWEAASKNGIYKIGITDHDHPGNNKFLKKQLEITKQHADIYQGLETSIRKRDGKLMISRRVMDKLDFLTVSEHIHIMPFYTFLKKSRNSYVDWWKDKSQRHKIDKFYTRHAEMTSNALIRYEPDILTHPWRFPWHRGLLDVATIEAYEPVLVAASKLDVKLEISRSILTLVHRELEKNNENDSTEKDLQKWQGEYRHELQPPTEFFARFYDVCNSHGISFALGSDAHRLQDIAVFPYLDEFLKMMHISERKILTDF